MNGCLVGGDSLPSNRLYVSVTKNLLEKDIESDTSGSLKRVLISLVQGKRDEGDANFEQAQADAHVRINI